MDSDPLGGHFQWRKIKVGGLAPLTPELPQNPSMAIQWVLKTRSESPVMLSKMQLTGPSVGLEICIPTSSVGKS